MKGSDRGFGVISRACKAGELYEIDGPVGIVERPQHGGSTCLVSRGATGLPMDPATAGRSGAIADFGLRQTNSKQNAAGPQRCAAENPCVKDISTVSKWIQDTRFGGGFLGDIRCIG